MSVLTPFSALQRVLHERFISFRDNAATEGVRMGLNLWIRSLTPPLPPPLPPLTAHHILQPLFQNHEAGRNSLGVEHVNHTDMPHTNFRFAFG